MSTITARPAKGEKFQKGVSFLKRMGFRFDGAAKVWTHTGNMGEVIDSLRYDATREQYLRRNGVELVSDSDQPRRDPDYAATHYVGQASMDHEDSIF